jgi:hypothetical protein
MPTTNEDFFSREQMQNMAMGLGQGLQGRDFASSFGAALSGTVGADLVRQQRREEREQRLEDLDAIEQRQIRAEERQRGYAVKDRDDLLKYYKQMRVAIADPGQAKKSADWKAFGNLFARLLGGNRPRFPGKSPISLYDESMTRDPSVGEPDMWDESMDAVDPYGQEIMRGVR